MVQIWEKSRHSGAALLLMLAIADFADDYGTAYPGVKRLAKKTRVKPRATQSMLDKLSSGEKPELTIYYNQGFQTKHGKTNKYKINLDNLGNLEGVHETTPQGVHETTPKPSVEPSVFKKEEEGVQKITPLIAVPIDENGDEVPVKFDKHNPFIKTILRNLYGKPHNLQGKQRAAFEEHILRPAHNNTDYARWCLWQAQNNAQNQTVNTYISWVITQEEGKTFDDWLAGRFISTEEWLTKKALSRQNGQALPKKPDSSRSPDDDNEWVWQTPEPQTEEIDF